MLTLRLALVGTASFALLGSMSIAVAAQDDAENGPVTHFTGTVLSQIVDTSDEEWLVDGDIGHARVFKALETVEWSGPRLPSEIQNVMNFDMYNIGEFRELPVTGTMLLEGPEGYWTGEFTSFCDTDGDCYGMNAITGHGAYERLFAVFRSAPPPDPEGEGELIFEGLIFEGEMPPFPDPIAPSGE